mmetsp:Transcript_116342/g.267027  ORF Transcript_116342/g.267027 Transcript_116342/m.267027 type:complete len:270 (-) Transcript_116342:150-959(-)
MRRLQSKLAQRAAHSGAQGSPTRSGRLLPRAGREPTERHFPVLPPTCPRRSADGPSRPVGETLCPRSSTGRRSPCPRRKTPPGHQRRGPTAQENPGESPLGRAGLPPCRAGPGTSWRCRASYSPRSSASGRCPCRKFPHAPGDPGPHLGRTSGPASGPKPPESEAAPILQGQEPATPPRLPGLARPHPAHGRPRPPQRPPWNDRQQKEACRGTPLHSPLSRLWHRLPAPRNWERSPSTPPRARSARVRTAQRPEIPPPLWQMRSPCAGR